ncbi:uncharacterized protein LOC34618126 [Cyclospora cayetanensis]|uniref:Uncharacterized protein LOC34618126 n=1 Tax=Cyclospora cayetanensis TaxID=88456 RepID=A0A6P6S5I3_9EIME|nr:uncharacterized protein LOC34618126 [Cyclospora cayetanensis]
MATTAPEIREIIRAVTASDIATTAGIGASVTAAPQRWETAPGTEAEGAATAAANQRRESVFAAIRSLKPDGWLWIGDAGYSEGEDVASVQEALRALKELKGWQALREELGFVDGTWDDHDFGMNDGGSNQENIDALQEAFLNFLGVASFSPRRQRKGLYSAHLFPLPQQAQEGKPEEGVRVLILDSRSHRDLHFIPSAAMLTLKPPLSLGHAYRGDILGEDQWTWLRAQLKHSKARVHILVSSIQILTGLPLLESWGHFPAARDRLLRLLQETKPRGLLLLSGDVHFTELLGTQGGVVELTSSGMTHSVGESLLTFSVLTPMLKPNTARRRAARARGEALAIAERADLPLSWSPFEKKSQSQGGNEGKGSNPQLLEESSSRGAPNAHQGPERPSRKNAEINPRIRIRSKLP